MKGCERIQAAILGECADVVPCAPMLIRFTAAYSGVSLRYYLTDGHRFAECQIRVAEAFDLDGIMCASEPTRVVHTLGGTVRFSEDGVPHVEEPAVSGPSDLRRLSPFPTPPTVALAWAICSSPWRHCATISAESGACSVGRTRRLPRPAI